MSENKIRKDHAVDGLMPDDHDIVTIVVKIEDLLDTSMNTLFHGNIAFLMNSRTLDLVLRPWPEWQGVLPAVATNTSMYANQNHGMNAYG